MFNYLLVRACLRLKLRFNAKINRVLTETEYDVLPKDNSLVTLGSGGGNIV